MEERSHSVTEAWRTEFVTGLHALRNGELARAEAHFARAHRAAPDRPEVCFALGRERLRRGRIADAECLLRAAWRGDPSLLSAAASLARCLGIHQDRPDEAHAVLDEAEAVHEAAPELAVTRGELLLENGRPAEAERCARLALDACGEDDPGAAATAARAVLARVENARGIALAGDGRAETALFAFKRAADLDPEWSAPLVNMGAAFAGLAKPARARAAYERAVAAEPGNPVAHFNLGLALREAGDPAAARARLERAAELEPDDVGIAAALAELEPDPERGVGRLSALAEASPGNPAAWTELGLACGRAGDRERAEGCLRRALELDPTAARAAAALADLLVRECRYAEAAVFAERAREGSPD